MNQIHDTLMKSHFLCLALGGNMVDLFLLCSLTFIIEIQNKKILNFFYIGNLAWIILCPITPLSILSIIVNCTTFYLVTRLFDEIKQGYLNKYQGALKLAEDWKNLLEDTPDLILITDLNTVQFVNNNLQNAIMSRSSLNNILTIVVIAWLPKENQIDKDDVKYEMAHSRIKNVL